MCIIKLFDKYNINVSTLIEYKLNRNLMDENLFKFYVVCLTISIQDECFTGKNEPRYEKTGFLHMRKQGCRSAAQYGGRGAHWPNG